MDKSDLVAARMGVAFFCVFEGKRDDNRYVDIKRSIRGVC